MSEIDVLKENVDALLSTSANGFDQITSALQELSEDVARGIKPEDVATESARIAEATAALAVKSAEFATAIRAALPTPVEEAPTEPVEDAPVAEVPEGDGEDVL